MNVLLFLALRAVHVLLAGLWIGSTVFVAAMLSPAVDASGPSGGQVMMGLNRRGFATYMSAIGAMTVLTGAYLLWRFTGGFDPSVAATHAGLAFGLGGASGILAGIIGGGVVGRGGSRLVTIMAKASSLTDGPARSALLQQASGIRRRMKTGSGFVIAFQTIALVLMAVGHYV